MGQGCLVGRETRLQTLERACDHRIDTCIIEAARSARTRCVKQTVQTVFDEAGAPLGNRLGCHALANGNCLVLHAVGTIEHDARTQCPRLRGLAPQGQCRELLALSVAEHELRLGSASHDHLVVLPHYTSDLLADN
jgi:hypothetical protein